MQMDSIGRRYILNVKDSMRAILASLTLSEISGAFGDLGTFLPLLVSLLFSDRSRSWIGSWKIYTVLWYCGQDVSSGNVGALHSEQGVKSS
jgi:hypothetical protein